LEAFRADSAPTFGSICADADDEPLENILNNDLHLHHHLLSPQRDNHFNLRSQMNRNLLLPLKTSSLNDLNFFMRLLFEDMIEEHSQYVISFCSFILSGLSYQVTYLGYA
jgi:hypothetical protein